MPDPPGETRALAKDGEPGELHRKQIEQQQPGCERRGADPGDAEGDDRAVDGRSSFRRGKQSERHADEKHEAEGETRELDRESKPLDDLVRDRFVRDDRPAEIESQRVLGPEKVLSQEGLVEVILVANCSHGLGSRLTRPEENLLRTARRQVEEEKDDERHRYEHGRHRDETAADEPREMWMRHLFYSCPRSEP